MPNQVLRPALARFLLVAGLILAPFAAQQAHAQTTAAFGLDVVLDSAEVFSPGAQLAGILTLDLAEGGASDAWFYLMQGADNASLFLVLRSGDEVTVTDVIPALPQFVLDLINPAPLPEDWIDSDAVFEVADAQGGASFRADHPDAVAGALLVAPPEGSIFSASLLPEGGALWVVLYLSEEDQAVRLILVDGQTPEPIEFRRTYARDHLALAAETAAAEFAADAYLVQVGTFAPDMTEDGKSLIWKYTYYSPLLDKARVLVGTSDRMVAGYTPLFTPASTTPLPEDWLDSDAAVLPVLDRRLDGFKDRLVTADLANGLNPGAEGAAWRFRLLGISIDFDEVLAGIENPDSLFFDPLAFLGAAEVEDEYVEATLDPELTDVEDDPGAGRAGLAENYPNPFRDATTIPFTLDKPGAVRVVVYDMLGREIRTLVDGVLPAGTHQVQFEAGGLASGLYLYRMERPDHAEVRRMTVMQ